MRRPNYARAAAPWPGLCLALICAPVWAGRSVQDGVLKDGVPLIGTQIGAGLQQYRSDSEARLLDWTSDGAVLVAVREGGQDQIRRLTGAAPDSQPQPLGAPGGTVRSAAAQPFHNEWVAYLGVARGAHGDEGAALGLRALSGDDTKTLVPTRAHPGTPVWAHDGRRLAFSAALRNDHSTDVYVLDTAASSGPRLVSSGNAEAREVLAWSSSDRSLLVRHTIAGTGDALLLVDIETGATRRVDAAGPGASAHAHIGEARLAQDDRGVYFLSELPGGHRALRYVDLYNNRAVELSALLGHEVEHFDVGTANRSIAVSWTEFGYSRIALLDRITNGVSVLPSLPPGAVRALRFDHGGTRLAVELAASTAPSDVYVCELGAKSCGRWTESKLGQYSAARLIAPQTVRFPTWDRPAGSGSALTALLYRPRNPGPYPVLIMLDGGAAPSAQLDPFVQYCVNELKVAVIAPGLREGESGVLDLGALLAWLGAQPDMRRDRVMVHGRGAGGTLALTALGLYGDRLHAAVSVDGMASSVQVLPIRKPVLLVRGLSSPALDAASAEQLLWRLRSAKIDSWFVAPRDRGERLSSEVEQLGAQSVIVQFIARQLGG